MTTSTSNTQNTETSVSTQARPSESTEAVNKYKGQVVVTALYKFTPFPDFADYRHKIQKTMQAQGVKGTLLIAHEGINGTIAGSQNGIDHVLDFLRSIPAIGEFTFKDSFVDEMPFYRTKVKLKKEIVTLGVEGIDPLQSVGRYVKPADWNALISDPEVVLVDTRNDYEVQIGTFQNAINPDTDTFREFPEYIKDNLDPEKNKKVAMFCTGGIRCEKSTAYLMSQGFEEVYHLEGGILKYLEEVPKEESMWEGECFVFDSRVAVNHDLEKGQYDQCYACRFPITEEDKKSESYEHGLSCPHCIDTITEKQRQRFYEREHQLQLAKERGELHIGGEVKEQIEARRQEKQRQKEEAKRKAMKS